MSHQSLIDDALNRAKARMSAGVGPTDKIASVGSDITKEAEEVANALEFVSLSMADDGSAAGAARASMVQDFLSKAAAGGGPAEGATTASGTQAQPPASGKKKIQPGGSPSSVNPEHSEAMEGKQPENIMRQMPPSTAPTPKSAGMSLYDVLMNNKEAAGGGALEMDAEQALPHMKGGNEGKAFADSLLGSNTAPVEATKRDAKRPTRSRLAEAWEGTSDTAQSAAGARATWPQATAKGELKVAGMSVAEMARGFQVESIKEAQEGEDRWAGAKRVGKGIAAGGAAGAAGGAALGALSGHRLQSSFGRKKEYMKGAVESGKAFSDAMGLGGADAKKFGKDVVEGAKSHIRHAKKIRGGMGAAALGAAGLAAGGLGAGAYHMYKKRQAAQQGKQADALSDYSELFDLALTGELGEEWQSWAEGVEAI